LTQPEVVVIVIVVVVVVGSTGVGVAAPCTNSAITVIVVVE